MKTNETDVVLTQEDFGILVTCATRYAIGRQSYMPYLVTGIVRQMLHKLDDIPGQSANRERPMRLSARIGTALSDMLMKGTS